MTLPVNKLPYLRPSLDNDPLTIFQEDLNNNDVKTEQSVQELEKKIESEKFASDLEINNDFNDIKTELVEKVLQSAEMTFVSGVTPKKPGLKMRKDMYKKKSMNTKTAKAGSSLKNKKKE